MTATMSDFTAQQIETSSRQLTRIRRRREIDRAHRGGEATERIANRLDESTGTISSEIRKLERRPNALTRTPMEVIDEYVVGERTRNDVIATLSSWPYTFGKLGITPGANILTSDAWDPGSWDDVKYARSSKLLDDDAFAQIARASDLPAAVFPHWVNGPTRKDPAA